MSQVITFGRFNGISRSSARRLANTLGSLGSQKTVYVSSAQNNDTDSVRKTFQAVDPQLTVTPIEGVGALMEDLDPQTTTVVVYNDRKPIADGFRSRGFTVVNIDR